MRARIDDPGSARHGQKRLVLRQPARSAARHAEVGAIRSPARCTAQECAIWCGSPMRG